MKAVVSGTYTMHEAYEAIMQLKKVYGGEYETVYVGIEDGKSKYKIRRIK